MPKIELTDYERKAIQGYLREHKEYALTERGTWHIIGGTDGSNNHSGEPGSIARPYFAGRYIDAVAHAVGQKGFHGAWHSVPNGQVVKIVPIKAKRIPALEDFVRQHAHRKK